MTSNYEHARRNAALAGPLHTPVPPALAAATFRLDADLLSAASGYVTLGHIKEALEAALAEWVQTRGALQLQAQGRPRHSGRARPSPRRQGDPALLPLRVDERPLVEVRCSA